MIASERKFESKIHYAKVAFSYENVTFYYLSQKIRSFINKRCSNLRKVRRREINQSTFKISFSQLNLGRRILASNNINQHNGQKHFINLLQEMHLLKNKKPSGLDQSHQIMHANMMKCFHEGPIAILRISNLSSVDKIKSSVSVR